MSEFTLSDFEIEFISESYADDETIVSALNDYQASGDKYQNLRKQSYITLKEALARDEQFTVVPFEIVAEVADLTAAAGYGKLQYQGGVEDARFSLDRTKGALKVIKMGKKWSIVKGGQPVGKLFDLSAQKIFDNLEKFYLKVRKAGPQFDARIMDAEGQTVRVAADGCPEISKIPCAQTNAKVSKVQENISFKQFINECLESMQ
ncbi:hypothetical protein CPT_Muldoon_147 [Serratia phage Muldoon]|uniref:Uncharacterized protein n=1 Tax=Serratia phage Muldoon TaxID=2601678 RepID=A0A5P8PH91_9CAUD|nr:hypothetical protein HYP94_gp243 [Serratia phage Muldoon]QFR56098.1 hypothetical protein CPT_Muldoon_147 [Serratia phage Muldoon]